MKAGTQTFQLSKIKRIGEVADEGPLHDFTRGGTPLIVNQEKVAQGLVNPIESNIAADFFEITVVLNERVQKHAGVEGILKVRDHQIC